MLIENNIKGKSVLICASLFLVLLNPVITWAENCPEGQKWNDRVGECVGSETTAKRPTKSKSLNKANAPNKIIYVVKGSKDYFSVADAINDRPVNNNHSQPDLKLVLQYPKAKADDSSLKYPLIVLIPSSQGLELLDEVKTARDFRKLGYATLLVYSYEARHVGVIRPRSEFRLIAQQLR